VCRYSFGKNKNILIIVQRDATQNSLFIILQVHSTCFGCQPHASSGVHRTVTTASGTGHSYLSPTWPCWREVLYTPDDGCGWHPKQAGWCSANDSMWVRILCPPLYNLHIMATIPDVLTYLLHGAESFLRSLLVCS